MGLIDLRKGQDTAKLYGVIFTCLASRAVHLEVTNFLDTDACISVLCHFIPSRCQVACVKSDNVTNFVGKEREQREAVAALNHSWIHEALH